MRSSDFVYIFEDGIKFENSFWDLATFTFCDYDLDYLFFWQDDNVNMLSEMHSQIGVCGLLDCTMIQTSWIDQETITSMKILF